MIEDHKTVIFCSVWMRLSPMVVGTEINYATVNFMHADSEVLVITLAPRGRNFCHNYTFKVGDPFPIIILV